MSGIFSLTVGAVLTAVAAMFWLPDLVEAQLKPAGPAILPELSFYAGSKSCIECHGNFYQLWATSRHGLAMQPYTPDLARANLTPQAKDLIIGNYHYRADIGPQAGWLLETDPKGKRKKYPIRHALGGKNVYYFLAPLERGRLQTLPVAYDVLTKQWFDTAASGIRHFGSGPPEEPMNWKEWPYTFNTARFNCHVSQYSSNYDLATDTHRTTWAEAGINCETCYGPSKEHNEAMQAVPQGQVSPDLKIISVKKFTPKQHTASLIHLTMAASDEGLRRALLQAIQDPSPLVRVAGAEALAVRPGKESFQALVTAAGDSYRLVRVRAVASLAHYPAAWFQGEDQNKLQQATGEYLASLTARPDQWTSHYNLGNYYLNQGKVKQALVSYDIALKIEPRAAMVMVNPAMAYAQTGEKNRQKIYS